MRAEKKKTKTAGDKRTGTIKKGGKREERKRDRQEKCHSCKRRIMIFSRRQSAILKAQRVLERTYSELRFSLISWKRSEYVCESRNG